MSRSLIFALGLCLLSSANATAQTTLSVLWQPQRHYYNSESLFYTPAQYIAKPAHQDWLVGELATSYSVKALDFSVLATAQQYVVDEQADTARGYANELFVSHSQGDWEYSLGRKISSWGVAYGARPLDIIQHQDQQRISRQSDKGKDGVYADYFGHQYALSIMYLFDTDNNQDNRRHVAAQYYTNRDRFDAQWVFKWSEDAGFNTGLGGVLVLSDALALHGEVLYSQDSLMQQHVLLGQTDVLLSQQLPYEEQRQDHVIAAVVGLSYTHANNQSVVLEYSYDESAYSNKQWDALFSLLERQRGLLTDPNIPAEAVWGNIAWSALAAQQNPRARRDLMLRWQWGGLDWQPTVTALVALPDQSRMLTLAIEHEFDNVYFDIGIRHFSGADKTLYGENMMSNTLYAVVSRDF